MWTFLCKNAQARISRIKMKSSIQILLNQARMMQSTDWLKLIYSSKRNFPSANHLQAFFHHFSWASRLFSAWRSIYEYSSCLFVDSEIDSKSVFFILTDKIIVITFYFGILESESNYLTLISNNFCLSFKLPKKRHSKIVKS